MSRRSKGPKKKSGGGMLMGMRTGFQKGARAAVGIGGDDKKRKKKTSLLSTILTVVLLIAVVAFLLRRQGII